MVCVTGENVEYHEEAHISYAVRLGKVFDLRSDAFFVFNFKRGGVRSMKIAYIMFDQSRNKCSYI